MKNRSLGMCIFLCSKTSIMAEPWANAGYDCWLIDIQHPPGWADTEQPKIRTLGIDVRRFDVVGVPGSFVFGFAFPPCTHLAVSGARWFREKGFSCLDESLSIVASCERILKRTGARWGIENPVSRLSSLQKPDYIFDPCNYAGYLDNPSKEAYTKKTCLWTGGGFVMPEPKHVDPVLGSKMHLLPPSDDRAEIRSITPKGFALAVFEANRPKES